MSTQAKRTDTRAKRGVQEKRQQNLTIIVAIVAVAILATLIFIFLNQSNAFGGSSIDYTGLVQERTDDGAFIIGNPDAPITLVEFADFRCPHCQDYYPTMEQFIEEFVVTGQARFEFRMLPTVDQTGSVMAIAECAADMYEGGFFPIHDEIFRITRSSNSSNVARGIADEFNLDLDALLRCSTDADQFVTDQRVAQSVGITGTPGIRIRYGDGPMQQIPGVSTGAPQFDVLAGVVLSATLTQ